MKLANMKVFTFSITKKANITVTYHLLREMNLVTFYKHFLEIWFLNSSSARRGKEVGLSFKLIAEMSQQQTKLLIFMISSNMTYYLLETTNLAVESAWIQWMMMIWKYIMNTRYTKSFRL